MKYSSRLLPVFINLKVTGSFKWGRTLENFHIRMLVKSKCKNLFKPAILNLTGGISLKYYKKARAGPITKSLFLNKRYSLHFF